MWKLVVVLIILIWTLFPGGVSADSSADVTVSASGWIAGAPGGLTLTYVSDYNIGISWTKGEDAANTMIRAAYGRVPSGITDGYQVYYGAGTSTNDTALSMATPDIIYYAAFSQNAGGIWSPLFATADVGGFMSASFLFIGLIALAGMLTFFSWKRKSILISLSGSLAWLSLGFWLFFGDVTNLSLSSTWTPLLGWVFIMMTFACLLFLMDTEIVHEAHGKKWVVYGSEPKEEGLTSLEAYRKELRRRLRR